jgi:hypothetical protein
MTRFRGSTRGSLRPEGMTAMGPVGLVDTPLIPGMTTPPVPVVTPRHTMTPTVPPRPTPHNPAAASTELGIAIGWALERMRLDGELTILAPNGCYVGAPPAQLSEDAQGNTRRYVLLVPLSAVDAIFTLTRAAVALSLQIFGVAEDGNLTQNDALAGRIDDLLNGQTDVNPSWVLTCTRLSPLQRTQQPLGKRYDHAGGIYRFTVRKIPL